MRADLVRGLIAGGMGTLALNVTTYADVATRGRPPSPVPEEMVGRAADRLDVDLGAGAANGEVAANRRTGLGALAGYLTGLGVGVAYGLARPRLRNVALPWAGLATGTAAMVVTDVSAAASGVTDPRTWGVKGWLADLVPHAVYGLVTAAVFDRID